MIRNPTFTAMKLHLFILMSLGTLLFCKPFSVCAQTDTLHHIEKDSTNATTGEAYTIPEPDEDFNIFLFVIATVFISVMIGAAITGAFAATLFLLLIFLFVSAGILSTSVIIGIYKKSLQSGFKSFLVIICSIAGMFLGSGAAFLVNKLFELSFSNTTSIISGAAGGLAGGILMGVAIFKILQIMAAAFKRKLNL